MAEGSRRGRVMTFLLLPAIVAALATIGAILYRRTSFQIEEVRQRSVFEATWSLVAEKVDRLDRYVIEQDNVLAVEVDVGEPGAVGRRWLPTAARETPTARAVLVLDLTSPERDVIAFSSRAPGPEDEAFRRLLVRRMLGDFELEPTDDGLRHLHKAYGGQSYLVSYWRRESGGRSYLVVVWHDVPRLVHEVFPRLYDDASGKARVNVLDEDGRLVYGARLRAGEFTVGRPFPTTLYGWRLQVALTAADDIGVEVERRRRLEFGLVATAGAVIVVGLAFILYAVEKQHRLSQQKGEFVANVSHEIKTPLALIRMFAEMLYTARVPSEQKRQQYTEIIMRESERLTALVDNVLDFARLERGEKAPLDFAPGDLGEVVLRAVEVVRTRAEREGVALVVVLPPVRPLVRLDARAVELALINLLDNALKYAASGKQIEVRLDETREGLEVAVSDAGPGIGPDERRKVFDRYVRGRAARDGRVRGSGIGLSLVKQIAERHGGSARVQSEPGCGATFVITVPRPRPGEIGAAGHAAENLPPAAGEIGRGPAE